MDRLLRLNADYECNMQAEKLLQEAREVARKAAGERRRNEGLAEVDDALYERLYSIVSKQIGQLRVVLEVHSTGRCTAGDNVPESLHRFVGSRGQREGAGMGSQPKRRGIR